MNCAPIEATATMFSISASVAMATPVGTDRSNIWGARYDSCLLAIANYSSRNNGWIGTIRWQSDEAIRQIDANIDTDAGLAICFFVTRKQEERPRVRSVRKR